MEDAGVTSADLGRELAPKLATVASDAAAAAAASSDFSRLFPDLPSDVFGVSVPGTAKAIADAAAPLAKDAYAYLPSESQGFLERWWSEEVNSGFTKARSPSHRSPYDPVGVVNAVPRGRTLLSLPARVSLRPSPHGVDPDTPRRLSTSTTDAFQLRPTFVALNDGTTRSQTVTVTGKDGPRRPRVGVFSDVVSSTATPAPLEVTWSSGRSAAANPRLSWWRGPSEANASTVVAATTATPFARSELCGAPANSTGWRDPGFLHAAIVRAPAGACGGTLSYRLSDDAGGSFPPPDAPPLTIAVPPCAYRDQGRNETAPFRPFTIAMFADMGRGTDDDARTWQEYGSPAFNVSKRLASDAGAGVVDAAFLFGDLSYATGYGSVWDEWGEQITPWASRVPFLTCVGNHEYDATPDTWQHVNHTSSGKISPRDLYASGDSGGECGVPARALYREPRPFAGGKEDTSANKTGGWWAATLGPIRIVSMNTEVDFAPGSPQHAFLEAALATANRNRAETPWVFFAGHRPMLLDSDFGARYPAFHRDARGGEYGDDTSDVGVALKLQKHVWPLVAAHKVDAVFGGHNHVYQRHCAFDATRAGKTRKSYGTRGCVARSEPTIDANGDVVHAYAATGAAVSFVVGSAGAGFTKTATYNAPFSDVTMYEYGYLRITVVNRTHLYGEFQETQFGKGVLDRFAITRRDDDDDDADADAPTTKRKRSFGSGYTSEEEEVEETEAGAALAALAWLTIVIIVAWGARACCLRGRRGFRDERVADDDLADETDKEEALIVSRV